jgi:hypothetical protein
MISSLEIAIVEAVRKDHPELNLPEGDQLKLVARTVTGGGRYTYVSMEGELHIDSGDKQIFDSGLRIEMDCLNAPLGGSIFVIKKKLTTIEIFVYGGEYWDGVERNWKFYRA